MMNHVKMFYKPERDSIDGKCYYYYNLNTYLITVIQLCTFEKPVKPEQRTGGARRTLRNMVESPVLWR